VQRERLILSPLIGFLNEEPMDGNIFFLNGTVDPLEEIIEWVSAFIFFGDRFRNHSLRLSQRKKSDDEDSPFFSLQGKVIRVCLIHSLNHFHSPLLHHERVETDFPQASPF
jgi:hypothetical protein